MTNVFTALLGARRTIGYHIPGLWCPDAATSPAFPDPLTEVDRWRALIDVVAPTSVEDSLSFPTTTTERATAAALVDARPYAIVHAGASDPARRWPTASFAAVADRLTAQGLTVVLTGTNAEAEATAAVQAAMTSAAVDLTGRTTLGEAAALIGRAALVVTNDTGTSHLAAALKTPSVVVFIASDPARWAPADHALHIAVGAGVPDVVIGSGVPRAQPQVPTVGAVIAAIDMLRPQRQVAA